MTAEAKNLSPIKTLSIEYWPIAKLIHYAKNPRKNDQAVERMCASIREFGFAVPILARSSGEVVDGHLRLKAAKKLGLVEVPVIICDGWSEAQVKAFRLMVNRSVAWADWDAGLLGGELIELKGLGFDLGLTGFDVGEIGRLTLQPDPAEDEAPPVPETPVTKVGDLWRLGEHRVLCGDSTDAECVGRLGDAFTLCFTSPPYNAGSYTLSGNVKKLDKSSRYEGRSDSLPEEEYLALLRKFTSIALDRCALVAVNIQQLAGNKFPVLRWVAGFTDNFVDRAVWYKGHGNPAMAPNVMASRYEDIWIFSPDRRPNRAIKTANFRGTVENVFVSVGASSENNQPGLHCATMPAAVARYAIDSWTQAGAIIFDPFLGCGTTLVAAQSTERICYGLEIDPGYCDVIVHRWEKLTGKQATLEATGQTLEQVRAGRRLEWADALHEEALEAK